MTGQLGVIYMLHFDRPYRHARHYVGNPGSSRFLKGSCRRTSGWLSCASESELLP